ncbi:MAG TPA: hypothetical protein VGQ62_23890 [Chloroflexota bacterium]|nr:hypothetical protein [Chloroflexota bacterium]
MPASDSSWATVAYETFEHGVIPWVGRPYAQWLRAWSRPHPGDPRGLMQLPTDVYQAFQQRAPGLRLSRQAAEGLGYPSVPGERDLDRVRRELKAALGRCDWDEAHDLDGELRDLQERVAAMRVTALKPRALGA